MIKAFIFDLDGTLLDSMHVWQDVGDAFLKEQGVHQVPPHLNETLKQMDAYQSAEHLCEVFGFTQSPDEIVAALVAKMEFYYREKMLLKEGALTFLQEHRNIPMCIATATRYSLARAALQRLGIEDYFVDILTTEGVGQGKQSPEIYMQAAAKLNTDIASCAVFEDALHAAETAKKAGFYVVGVSDKSSAKDEMALRSVCDVFVETLTEYRYQ